MAPKPKYINEETGQEVTDFNPDDYELVRVEGFAPNVARHSAADLVLGVGDLVNFGRFAGEQTGLFDDSEKAPSDSHFPSWDEYSSNVIHNLKNPRGIPDLAKQYFSNYFSNVDANLQDVEDWRDSTTQASTLGNMIAKGAGGIARVAPGLAATMAGGGSIPLSLNFAAGMGGQRAESLREAGVSPEDQTYPVMLDTAIGGAGGALLPKVGGFGDGLLSSALYKTPLSMAMFGGLADFARQTGDAMLPGAGELDPAQALGNSTASVVENFPQTYVSGAMFGALGGAGKRPPERFTEPEFQEVPIAGDLSRAINKVPGALGSGVIAPPVYRPEPAPIDPVSRISVPMPPPPGPRVIAPEPYRPEPAPPEPPAPNYPFELVNGPYDPAPPESSLPAIRGVDPIVARQQQLYAELVSRFGEEGAAQVLKTGAPSKFSSARGVVAPQLQKRPGIEFNRPRMPADMSLRNFVEPQIQAEIPQSFEPSQAPIRPEPVARRSVSEDTAFPKPDDRARQAAPPAEPPAPEPIRTEVPASTPSTQPEQLSLLDPIRNERGSIVFSTPKVFENASKKIEEKLTDWFDAPEAMDRLARQSGDPKVWDRINEMKVDDARKFMEGRAFGKKVVGLSPFLEVWREKVARPSVVFEKMPEALRGFKMQREKMAQINLGIFKSAEKAQDFFDIADPAQREQINQVLDTIQRKSAEAFDRGAKVLVADKALAESGLEPSSIKAIKAAFSAMEDIHTQLEAAMLKNNEYGRTRELATAVGPDAALAINTRFNKSAEAIRKNIAEKKLINYIPISRHGDYFVYGRHPETGKDWYNFYDKPSQRDLAAKNLLDQEYDGVQKGELYRPSKGAYSDMPSDLLAELGELAPTPDVKTSIPGFRGHLMQRKGVEGYKMDAWRNIADYITSAHSYIQELEYGPKLRDLQKSLPSGHPTTEYFNRWLDFVNSNSKEAGTIKSGLAHYFIGFLNPKAGILQATQPITTSLPELRRYTEKPEKALLEAQRLYRLHEKNPEAFAKAHPELARDLDESIHRGKISDRVTRQLYGIGRGNTDLAFDITGKKKTWSDLSMSLTTWGSRRSSIIDYIAAHNSAPKGASRSQFAEEFVDRVEFIYDKTNRPEIARGLGAAPYALRLYGHNQLGNMVQAAKEWAISEIRSAKGVKDIEAQKLLKAETKKMRGVVGRYLAGSVALGGIRALPLVSAAAAVLAVNGVDTRKWAIQQFGGGEWGRFGANLLLNGPLSVMFGNNGINLSGSIAPGDLPDFSRSVPSQIARATLGPMWGVVTNIDKGITEYKNSKNIPRAISRALPSSLASASDTLAMQLTGEYTNPRGQVILDNPSMLTKLLKLVSFQPTELGNRQEAIGAAIHKTNEIRSETEGLLRGLAVAKRTRNRAEWDRLQAYARSIGKRYTNKEVSNAIRRLEDPFEGEGKKLPKKGERGQRAQSELREIYEAYQGR